MNRQQRRAAAKAAEAESRATALFREATEYHRTGRLDAALAAYRETLRLVPQAANVHAMLATCLMDTGDRAAAETPFREAARLAPGDPDHQQNLGMWLLDAGRKEDAVEPLRRAVAAAPDNLAARTTLGLVLGDLGRLDEAETQLRRVLAASPGDIAAAHGLALVSGDRGDTAESERMLRDIAAAPSAPPSALTDLAGLLRRIGRDDDALAVLDDALSRFPNDRQAFTHRALLRLIHGDFARGWADYVAGAAERAPDCSLEPLPDDFAGRRVRVDRDQGLGDELFFMRFVPPLKARGAHVIYRSDPRLCGMFSRLDFVDEALSIDDPPPPADIAYNAADLPWLLGTDGVETIPPYIDMPPIPDRVAALRQRLEAAGPAPYVAVTWRAGLQQRGKLSRIAPQDAISGALAACEATLIAVQRLPKPGEIDALSQTVGRTVHDFTAVNDDLEDMLALLELVDDYVCVDNTNTQMRTARGKTARVLVPFPPEFRWMTEGPESPWFPGCVAYRERYADGWSDAADELTRDLSEAYPATARRR